MKKENQKKLVLFGGVISIILALCFFVAAAFVGCKLIVYEFDWEKFFQFTVFICVSGFSYFHYYCLEKVYQKNWPDE